MPFDGRGGLMIVAVRQDFKRYFVCTEFICRRGQSGYFDCRAGCRSSDKRTCCSRPSTTRISVPLTKHLMPKLVCFSNHGIECVKVE